MNKFKSQVELTTFAYHEVDGNQEEMVKLVAQLLAEHHYVLKTSKRDELDEKGTKGYVAYAKVKVREHFKRVLPRSQKAEFVPPQVSDEVPVTGPQASTDETHSSETSEVGSTNVLSLDPSRRKQRPIGFNTSIPRKRDERMKREREEQNARIVRSLRRR